VDACAICAPRLQEAANLYRGKFLQEFFLADNAEFEEWALARREAFHQRALDALTDLANYYEQHGDASATRRCAMRALELDPWREPAHRQMMRVFAREGDKPARHSRSTKPVAACCRMKWGSSRRARRANCLRKFVLEIGDWKLE
jgi:DNA-binding SARP family transcriptional activator